jgi:predicted AAA+ superfamily ATPase
LKGQFILSGSQTPTYNADRHTGALRIGNIKMNTMNAFETGISSCEVKFTDLFDKNKVINGEKIFSEDECLDFIIKGGWPYNISLTSYESSIALHSYINSIAYEDIKKITKQPDKERTKALISSLARNIASTVSHEVLATDSQIINSPKTIRKYLDFLEKIYLIEEVSV